LQIQSGLHCRSYPRIEGKTFKDARPLIRKHLSEGCSDCESYFQRFLRKEPKSGEITVRGDVVKRWTLNGPSTGLKRHPLRGFYIEAIQDAIEAQSDYNEVVLRILYFEIRILTYLRIRGVKRQRAHRGFNHKRGRGRRSGTGHPWEYETPGEDRV
jgi:hypothetical protein